MKNSTVSIILVTAILVIFVGYFSILNLNFENEIGENLKLAENYTMKEDWNKVLEISTAIKESWNNEKHFIMFNFAETEFSTFENHLNHIIGGANAKQLDITLSNILAAEDIWKNMNRVVPEP
ncbi:hypothetical protein [Clostridium brassicae]|uniref:DUF4363 family protein n=1 Tax=Clostridium brassicae TaxID=2999072 RepID=A0ABT4DC70_9CLOT|nr:hypothetical protein [Clostridium brassicae]MCY6959909.1 hypothetical protein [Clostridium brassicae]